VLFLADTSEVPIIDALTNWLNEETRSASSQESPTRQDASEKWVMYRPVRASVPADVAVIGTCSPSPSPSPTSSWPTVAGLTPAEQADLQQRVMGFDRRVGDRDGTAHGSTNEMTAMRQCDTPTCIRTRCHPNLHHLLRVFTGSIRKPVHVRGLLPTDVGGLRWALFGACALYVLLSAILPVAALVYASVQRLAVAFPAASNFTLDNFRQALSINAVRSAMANSLALGAVAATIGVAITGLLSWVILRTRLPGRGLLEYVVGAAGRRLIEASRDELQVRHEQIGDVRGAGLMLGVDLVRDRESRTPDAEFGTVVTKRCLELGLNVNIVKFPALGSVLRLAPPLTISEADLDLGLEVLDRALGDAAAASMRGRHAARIGG